MNDITLEELINALTDDSVKAWVTQAGQLPTEFTVCRLLMQLLEGSANAARVKNETLEPGAKILAYPAAVNGGLETSKNGVLFFRSTRSVNSAIVVDMDGTQAPNG